MQVHLYEIQLLAELGIMGALTLRCFMKKLRFQILYYLLFYFLGVIYSETPLVASDFLQYFRAGRARTAHISPAEPPPN